MAQGDKEVKIPVPSRDPTQNKKERANKDADASKLSEEDERIKEQVDLLVTRVADSDPQIAKVAAEQLCDLLRSNTGASVASVPRPLKYVRASYDELEKTLSEAKDDGLKQRLNDILSFVSMTIELPKARHAALEHKLNGTKNDLALWGHEYLRFLSGAISNEWTEECKNPKNATHLSDFVDQILRYMLEHQDEPTAVDLLMEIEQIERILPLVEKRNFKRICAYMSAMSKYLTRPTDRDVLEVVYDVYVRMEAYSDALATALLLNNRTKVEELFTKCTNKAIRLQMAITCARTKFFIEFDEEEELLSEACGNMRLSQLYRFVAQELDSMAPKTPDEILKTSESSMTLHDSRFKLASTFVSGLANCGFGKDEYLTETLSNLLDARESRHMSSAAFLGLLYLWDYTDGLQEIDKLFYSNNNNIKAGACLAAGITMCGIKNPFDPALGLLMDHVNSSDPMVDIGAILGIGYAYAGTQKQDVKELLAPVVADASRRLEVQCLAAFALALVFGGSGDEDLSEVMMNCLMEVKESSIYEPCIIYLVLALGCMFLGRCEDAETLLDVIPTLPLSIRRYTEIVVRSCAFAATGNVVVIQNLFHIIAEVDDSSDDEEEESKKEGGKEKEKEKDKTSEENKKKKEWNYKAAAVLGIGLVALGEDLGTEMAKRSIIHVLLADTVSKGANAMSGRHAVPLVFALLSASNPVMPVVETLNRLSHDSDSSTATNAILALGIVSAGSNNARVAGKLRSLSQYYHKTLVLFIVQLAQGFCAMGKGHLTLSPLLNDRTLVSPSALIGLLGLLHSALQLEKTVMDKYHYMLLSIVPSISPRLVLAVDDNMEPIKEGVQVRVGLPVDTVALPGKPKSVTGFQTQSTPVLLSATDKVEAACAPEYRPMLSTIEGIFVVESSASKEDTEKR